MKGFEKSREDGSALPSTLGAVLSLYHSVLTWKNRARKVGTEDNGLVLKDRFSFLAPHPHIFMCSKHQSLRFVPGPLRGLVTLKLG